MSISKRAAGLAVFAATMVTANLQAASLNDYLIVGQQINESTVDVSNYELGKISTLDSGNYTDVNSPGVGPSTGTYNDAKIAVLETSGTVKMSNIDMYGTGTTGIDCAGSYSDCTDNGGNLSNVDYNGTSIGDGNGALGGVDLGGVSADIALAQDWVAGLSTTGSIDTDDGKISGDLVVNLSAGLNVFDFTDNGGALDFEKDILVENGSLIFQGGVDDYAVILINEASNFLTSNGNLVIGDGGIGLNNVVFIAQNAGTDASINISNSYINGVALWDIDGDLNNNLSLDNTIGCTQLVGDDVDIQNVRLNQCAFDTTVVPIPPALALFPSALAVLGWIRRRKFSA